MDIKEKTMIKELLEEALRRLNNEPHKNIWKGERGYNCDAVDETIKIIKSI